MEDAPADEITEKMKIAELEENGSIMNESDSDDEDEEQPIQSPQRFFYSEDREFFIPVDTMLENVLIENLDKYRKKTAEEFEEEHQKEIDTLKDHNDSLLQKLSSLMEDEKNKPGTSGMNVHGRSGEETLQRMVTDLKTRLQASENKTSLLEKEKTERSERSADLEALRSKLQTAEKKNERLEKSNAEQESARTHTLSKQLQAAQKHLTSCVNKKADLETEYEKLNEKYERLAEEMGAKKIKEKQFKKEFAALRSSSSQIDSLKEELRQVDCERANIQRDYAELEGKYKKLEDEAKLEKEKRQKLENVLALERSLADERVREDFKKLKEELNNSMTELERKTKELNRCCVQLKEVTEAGKRLHRRKTEVEGQLETLQNKLIGLKNTVERKQTACETLNSTLKAERAEILLLKEQNRKLSNEFRQLKCQMESGNMEKESETVLELRKKVEELQGEIKTGSSRQMNENGASVVSKSLDVPDHIDSDEDEFDSRDWASNDLEKVSRHMDRLQEHANSWLEADSSKFQVEGELQDLRVENERMKAELRELKDAQLSDEALEKFTNIHDNCAGVCLAKDEESQTEIVASLLADANTNRSEAKDTQTSSDVITQDQSTDTTCLSKDADQQTDKSLKRDAETETVTSEKESQTVIFAILLQNEICETDRDKGNSAESEGNQSPRALGLTAVSEHLVTDSHSSLLTTPLEVQDSSDLMSKTQSRRSAVPRKRQSRSHDGRCAKKQKTPTDMTSSKTKARKSMEVESTEQILNYKRNLHPDTIERRKMVEMNGEGRESQRGGAGKEALNTFQGESSLPAEHTRVTAKRRTPLRDHAATPQGRKLQNEGGRAVDNSEPKWKRGRSRKFTVEADCSGTEPYMPYMHMPNAPLNDGVQMKDPEQKEVMQKEASEGMPEIKTKRKKRKRLAAKKNHRRKQKVPKKPVNIVTQDVNQAREDQANGQAKRKPGRPRKMEFIGSLDSVAPEIATASDPEARGERGGSAKIEWASHEESVGRVQDQKEAKGKPVERAN